MIKHIVSDFSRVLLFPLDKDYPGRLNALHSELLLTGEYDFWSYFELNQPLFDLYKSLANDYSINMFTAEYIQNYPPVKEVLDTVFVRTFIARDLGVKKTEPRAFEKLAILLSAQPDEILYIDDSPDVIAAAQQFGVQTIQFTTTEETITSIKSTLQI